jgi:hypothetical protein
MGLPAASDAQPDAGAEDNGPGSKGGDASTEDDGPGSEGADPCPEADHACSEEIDNRAAAFGQPARSGVHTAAEPRTSGLRTQAQHDTMPAEAASQEAQPEATADHACDAFQDTDEHRECSCGGEELYDASRGGGRLRPAIADPVGETCCRREFAGTPRRWACLHWRSAGAADEHRWIGGRTRPAVDSLRA